MTKILNILFFYYVFFAVWMIVIVSFGFVATWVLFFLKEPLHRRRPGINLKEF